MEKYQFQKAVPIWAAGREKEMNCELAFKLALPMSENSNGKSVLALAASTIYRVRINGNFVAAGPARAAHGTYCVDELDITERLTKEQNVIVIEVVGYNVNSYDTLDQPAFLQAEILHNYVPVSWTGGNLVQIYDLQQRVQKVQRYSFQRAFAECYRLNAATQNFHTIPEWEETGIRVQEMQVQPEKCCIRRRTEMPQFEVLPIQRHLEIGTAEFTYQSPDFLKDKCYTQIREQQKGYTVQELEEHLSNEGRMMVWKSSRTIETDFFEPLSIENGYGLYCFPFNTTGFLHLRVECEKDCIVYVLFDEILCEGKVDFLRPYTCNCFKYYIDAGKHDILTFAPYTMKYVQVAVKGECTLHSLDMMEYKHPAIAYDVKLPEISDQENAAIRKIYKAALETYLSNSVDIFMDCPSRERAGYLCDSFFTSRVEYVLTGKSVVERAFLENFLIAQEFKYLPKGMLPMCYPADHYNGNFIPNWAMWFVLELEEYYNRSGDKELIRQAKDRVYGLLDYFKSFENQHGLLERLQGWIFVEWSRANDKDVVQEVNFPTNMLYAKMLRVVATLYQDEALLEKSVRLKKVIRDRSKGNVFFTDNERTTSEGYVNPGNCTEVCQYYAFFTGIASKEEDSELWEILMKDFGPQRKETKLHPQVAFANAFIGNYLRIELLYRDGQYDQVLDNIRGYFAKMAEITGTLWEHEHSGASCNHGFASHVIYWLAGIYGMKPV